MLVCLLLAFPSIGQAALVDLNDPVNQWLPSSDGATWTYEWSNTSFAPTPTKEIYTIGAKQDTAFRLDWTTAGADNGEGTIPAAGIMEFDRTEAGLINLGWTSTPPPPGYPILCAQPSECANSLVGTMFMTIWGSRSPVLAEPLLRKTRWTSVGGADNDVSSENRYLGVERVAVPAFPDGIDAAKVESTVTQAGAIGDPFGSGVRTVWWARGVGPVRVVFRHASGEQSTGELFNTNLTPLPLPSDVNYLPFTTGDTMTYRWSNSKHMKKYSEQRFSVAAVSNNTARVDVESLDGPIRVGGSYIFATRLEGITSIAASTQSQSIADFPPLGPRSQPAERRRHLLTPFDFMTFGFNPVLPGYPDKGVTWQSDRSSSDFKVFGVTGESTVLGMKKVKTPAGKFQCARGPIYVQAERFPLRQRYADQLLRPERRARETRLQAQGRQHLDRRARQVVRLAARARCCG